MTYLLAALLTFAILYQLAAAWLVQRFRTREVDPPVRLDSGPPVSHLKPVHGVTPRTPENLRSYIDQDYPGPIEVVFTAGRPDDPVIPVCQELAAADPRIKVIAGDASGLGTNPKVASMIQGYPHCTCSVILSTDSDMFAPPGYMHKMLAPMRDPKVGMVTCLYCIQRVHAPAMALEALAVLDFSTSVLVARALEGMSFGLGANMCMRREALEEIGGVQGMGEYLAEDYQLGNRMHRKGWKVVLAGTVVEDVLGEMTLTQFLSHQLRWMRTYRISRPGGHFAYVVTQGSAWVLGLLALHGLTPLTAAAAGLWLAVRSRCALANWEALGGVDVGRWCWLVPIKDLFYLGLWLTSLVGNRVRWGPRELQLRPDGTMVLIRRHD